MNCLKCGRETQEGQVFCQECLLEMERFPVKPGTAIQLPKRRESTAVRRTAKRKNASLEDQVKILRKRIRLLTVLLIFSLVLVAAFVYPTVRFLMRQPLAMGQNYSSVTTATAPSTTWATIGTDTP